jgi:hypothetical protein
VDLVSREPGDVDEVLHREAVIATGLVDFGDDHYREGLGRMLFDLERATGGGEAFRVAAANTAQGALVGRLYSQRGWTERPDVLKVPIVSPVMIVGSPRTGTTMMHKLLSMEDRFQVLQSWLISYPMARPTRERWADYPEFKAATADIESQPEHRHLTHFVAAEEADECLMLVNQSFVSVMFGARFSLAAYDEWMVAQDWTVSLRRHADNLRLIGADEPRRRWLLKNPSYVLAMRELLSVYPDARVVWMHRDPQQAMGSLVDLLWANYGGNLSERVARELPLWAEGMRRTQEVRFDHDEAFFDVDYELLTADPLRVATRLLEWLGMDMTSETRGRMRWWLEQNPQGKRGVHRYAPAELGVSEEAVHLLFAPYIERYGLGRS